MHQTYIRFSFLATLIVVLWLAPVQGFSDVVPAVHRRIHQAMMDDQADALNFQEFADSLTNQGKSIDAYELYPALDIYSDWDDDHVDFTRGKTNYQYHDSLDIDLRGFVAPVVGRVNSPYGWRRRRMHRGVDLKLYVGDTVRAAFDGQVRIRKFDRRGYGYYYVVRHPNGLETVYGHLSKQIVEKDQYVKAGQALGLGGNTGRSTGPHLHLEFRVEGIDLNPADLINFETFEPKQMVYKYRRKQAKKVSEGIAGSGDAAYHKVKSGDTLGAIARRYGTSVSRLCKLNGIRSNSILRIGQRIRYR